MRLISEGVLEMHKGSSTGSSHQSTRRGAGEDGVAVEHGSPEVQRMRCVGTEQVFSPVAWLF